MLSEGNNLFLISFLHITKGNKTEGMLLHNLTFINWSVKHRLNNMRRYEDRAHLKIKISGFYGAL